MLRILLSLFLAVTLLASPLMGSAEACCIQPAPESDQSSKTSADGCFELETNGKSLSTKQVDDKTHDRDAKAGRTCHHCCHVSSAILPVRDFAGRLLVAEMSIMAWRTFHFRSRTLAPLLEPPAKA